MGVDNPSLKILIVDDNPDDIQFYTRVLSHDPDAQYTLIESEVGEDGLRLYHEHHPDCVLLGFNLPDMDGVEFMRRLAQEGDGSGCLPVVMLTGQGNEAVAVEAMKSGVCDYLVKGDITPDALRRAIRNVIEKVSLERKNRQLTQELQIANDGLIRKNKKLEELTETAHRFVDNVAHDFRTPLTVIKEFSSIISDGLGGPVTEEQAEYLLFITTATRDLAQMVDDFLDSSKLKARVLRIDRKPHSVDGVIQPIRSMLTTRASAKKIRVVERIQPNLPQVFADAEKVARVIMNLAVNAVKFSPESSEIQLWAKRRGSGCVEIGITDHGPGLTEEDLAVIFERFKQVGDIQRASTKGFGLGLNIAKELVWLNLGTVNVQSQRGHGSTFSFTLPVCDQPAIINQYFERLDELSEPPTHMVVLQVTPTVPLGDLEPLRLFLASACYPMDLVLKVPHAGSILAVGSTGEPQQWIKRLESAWSANKKKRGAYDLRIHNMAWLPYAEIKKTDLMLALRHMTELRSCA